MPLIEEIEDMPAPAGEHTLNTKNRGTADNSNQLNTDATGDFVKADMKDQNGNQAVETESDRSIQSSTVKKEDNYPRHVFILELRGI